MRYRESLQVQLQERYRRLYKANFQSYHHEAGYLVEFIRSTPGLLLRFSSSHIALRAPSLSSIQRSGLPKTLAGNASIYLLLRLGVQTPLSHFARGRSFRT